MNEQLRRDKQHIREYIREHFSDEKLAQVYAFNRDGKMEFYNRCACLLGVTLSAQLHEQPCADEMRLREGKGHYLNAKRLGGACRAEMSYGTLATDYARESWGYHLVSLRQCRLSAILRAELRRRDRLASPVVSSQDELVLAK